MSDAWATAVAAIGASAVTALVSYLGHKQADKNSKREDDRRRTERRIEYLEARREHLAKEFDDVFGSIPRDNSKYTMIVQKCYWLFPDSIRKAFDEALDAADAKVGDDTSKDHADALCDELHRVYRAMQIELKKVDEEIDGLTSNRPSPGATDTPSKRRRETSP